LAPRGSSAPTTPINTGAIAEVNAELAASRASGGGDAAPQPAPRPGPGRVVVAQGSRSAGSPSTFAVAQAQARPPVSGAQSVALASGGQGSTGGNAWGVQLGAFRTKGEAERHLLTMALQDIPALNGGLRRIEGAKVQGVTFFRAQFVGLSQDAAEGACATLARESAGCQTLAPGI
jgi:D-alanyl-D-alanine carboxypeptidase